jgi:hypothetical protein
MNSRQLRWLSVIALAVVIAAVWIGFTRTATSHSGEQRARLYPALQGQLAKVQAVRIFIPGDQLGVELARSTSSWTVKQRNGYPADTQKVNALLLALEDAKLREEKTSNPASYATLGVQDLTAPGAVARIEISGPDLAPGQPINLIVGKSDAGTRASYVRRAGEAKSWLTDEILVSVEAATWLQRDLLSISADRIQEVQVQIANSPRYSAVKEKRADASFDVTPLPKKRELNSVSAVNLFAQALTSLQLDDVRPIADFAGKSAAQTNFHTFDGLIIELSGYVFDGKQWISVKASFDESLAKRFHVATESKDIKTDTSVEAASNKIRTEAELLNKQLGQWTYAIAPYKYDAIFKPVEQLLKKL